MKRIIFNFMLLVGIFLFVLQSCNTQPPVSQTSVDDTAVQPAKRQKLMDDRTDYFVTISGDTIHKVFKSPDDWRQELDKTEFYVLREAGTERAFTGDLWDNKKQGVYTCRGCQLPLFDSDTKFKSGTGWPSFFKPIEAVYIEEKTDNKYGWNRVEVLCNRCGGHLGHVFEDGPAPTGLRYCINSVSLDFEEKK